MYTQIFKEFWTNRSIYYIISKGFTGTSIDELTKGMELSRSSLYDSFGDKKDIFIEALTHYIEFTSG
jgi:TetR/AcrR family transcriptional repressor of nem operon